MPEMPEVETIRLSLLEPLEGKTIKNVEVLHEKLIRLDPKLVDTLKGHTIKTIERIGKLLMFHFKETDRVLLIHLKMTGQLIYARGDKRAGGGHSLRQSDLQLPHLHSRVVIHFTDDSALYFNDLRLFAYLRTVSAEELVKIKGEYGIEPLKPDFTWEAFQKLFARRKTILKAFLLNQTIISGLGNIYVDESCHVAGLLPTRNVQTLKPGELKALFDAINTVMKEAVANGGTTFHSFLDGDGKEGGYRNKLQVYGRQGKPCFRCGTLIQKIEAAGRGTHFCPGCQK